jgi:hypothetical protein
MTADPKRRRGRFLSFVGALIVFATFIAKDVKEDELKDTKGTISGALTLFTVQNDLADVSKQLTYRVTRVDYERWKLAAKTDKAKIYELVMEEALTYAHLNLDHLDHALKVSEGLMKVLPDNDVFLKAYIRFVDKMTLLKEREKTASYSIDRSHQLLALSWHNDHRREGISSTTCLLASSNSISDVLNVQAIPKSASTTCFGDTNRKLVGYGYGVEDE